MSTTGRQEDLYVLERDGTGLRQLTNDAHKDRGPSFSPDGGRLLFFSNRSGSYEAWSVRLDGSGLTQMTRTVGSEVTEVGMSPDASVLVMNLDRGVGLARLGASLPVSPEPCRRSAAARSSSIRSGRATDSDSPASSGTPPVVGRSRSTRSPRRPTATSRSRRPSPSGWVGGDRMFCSCKKTGSWRWTSSPAACTRFSRARPSPAGARRP